jgi:hypothetical protein
MKNKYVIIKCPPSSSSSSSPTEIILTYLINKTKTKKTLLKIN